MRKGWINPVLAIPRARFGGTVREVRAKAGDRVEAGQVLLRFEAKDLEARLTQLRKAAQTAEAAVKGGNAMSQIPNQARQYLYEMHPATVRAEQEYVEALAAFESAKAADRAAATERLRQATKERPRVRRHLGQLFAGGASSEDSRSYVAQIASNIAEVEKAMQDTEVRSPTSAVVDLLDAQPGEKFQPGQPVAVLLSLGAYSLDLAVTQAESLRLYKGMALTGSLENSQRKLEGRIESITTRKLPVIARENLQLAEEFVARVRIVSAAPLSPGTMATFIIP